jgi:outer membrane immunogenic protein
MRSIFGPALIAAALALMATVAQAAPPASPPAGLWTGAYVGGDAGLALGGTSATTEVACDAGGLLCAPSVEEANGAWIGEVGSGPGSATAFTGGIFAGHNWQSGNFVYGLEGDFGATPLSVSAGGSAETINSGLYNSSAPEADPVVYDEPSVFTMTTTASIDWLASARVRAGVLVSPTMLIYGTAGVSATSLTVSNSYADNFTDTDRATGNVESSRSTALRTGLIIGAGAEWVVAPRLKLRAEYLHTEFSALSTTGLTSLPPELQDFNPITSTATLHADLFRLGLAYGF